MKKNLLVLIIFWVAAISFTTAQVRYQDLVFPTATVSGDITYGNNITIIGGTPASQALKMDVYMPAGDACTSRPMVIYLHAGTVLPIIYNQACVGTKSDSSVVEICTQFARRGYVAVAMDYRLGWNANAIGVDPDVTLGTIFQAIYRGIQDAKACVRFFKANVATGGNTYGVDTTRISLGGVGTGAIIALNYVALRDTNQLWLPKFLSGTTNATYGFVAGMPYINIHTLGDFDGYGGIPQLNNPNNNPGHTTNVQMLFSIYGVIGDSTWINPNFPPTVALHPFTPPTGGGPYHWGTIFAGNTGIPILPDVSGPHQFICKLDAMGVNAVFTGAAFSDVYTAHANTINTGCEALFPFVTGINPNIGNTMQEDMWDWFSLPALEFVAPLIGATAAMADTAYVHSLYTNPNMSKTQALAYIDTIENYLAPRLYVAFGLGPGVDCILGINELSKAEGNISVFPNPASDNVSLSVQNTSESINKIEMFDVRGRLMVSVDKLNNKSYSINTKNFERGIYFVKLMLGKNEVVKKITLQ